MARAFIHQEEEPIHQTQDQNHQEEGERTEDDCAGISGLKKIRTRRVEFTLRLSLYPIDKTFVSNVHNLSGSSV